MAVVYHVADGEPRWLKPVKASYPILVSGLMVGGTLGFIVWGEALEVFAAAVSCAVGGYLGFSREGFGGFVVGLFASVAGSLAASILHGMFVWGSGVERTVVVLVITRVSGGPQVGFVFGLLGTFLGFLVTKFGGAR